MSHVFKVGDIVRAVREFHGNSDIVNKVGEVVDIRSGAVGVKFTEYVNGHNLHGRCEAGYGWVLSRDVLAPAEIVNVDRNKFGVEVPIEFMACAEGVNVIDQYGQKHTLYGIFPNLHFCFITKRGNYTKNAKFFYPVIPVNPVKKMTLVEIEEIIGEKIELI